MSSLCVPQALLPARVGQRRACIVLRMRMSQERACVLLAALILVAAPGWAQEHFQVDPANSQVRFQLGATGHAVDGTFRVSSGSFTLDAQSGAMTGTVTVDAASGQSDNKGRDKKMTNDELKAQTFPAVTFSPAKFAGQVKESGDSSGQVDGTLTLLGQGHPISVPMTVHMDKDRFNAEGHFTIPYVNWGIKDPSVMFLKVAKEVKIDLKLTGTVGK